MLYNFAADSFCTKKLCSRLSLREVHFCVKNGHFALLSPPLASLEVMHAVHLRLIGKLVMEFLLVVIELFLPCAVSEVLLVNNDWKSPF